MRQARCRRYRASAILALSLVGALVTAAAASATPPTNEQVVRIPYAFSVDCRPYGFAFSNIVQGVETDRFQTFYDSDGNAVKVVDHGGFTETDTNSVTGKTLGLTQSWINTYDLPAGTRTVTGKALVMTDAGKGAVILDAGRVVFDRPGNVVFAAGPHAPLYGNLDQMVCTALAST